MNRIKIAQPHGGLLVVGWNRHLESFYALVFKAGTMDGPCGNPDCGVPGNHGRQCDDAMLEVWTGKRRHTHPTVESLVHALRYHLRDRTPEIDVLTKAKLTLARSRTL